MQLYSPKRRSGYKRLIASAILFLLMIVLALYVFSNMQGRVDSEQTAQLVDALRRAAVTCYAIEGRYPPTLAYLSEQYGVSVDTKKFAVEYQVYAPNIMPDIEVTLTEGVSQ